MKGHAFPGEIITKWQNLKSSSPEEIAKKTLTKFKNQISHKLGTKQARVKGIQSFTNEYHSNYQKGYNVFFFSHIQRYDIIIALLKCVVLEWFLGWAMWPMLNFIDVFHYFVIISPLKRAWPFIWTYLSPLHPRMLVASMVEIGSVVLKKILKFRQCTFANW